MNRAQIRKIRPQFNILLLDKDSDRTESLRETLHTYGYKMDGVSSVDKLMQKIKKVPPHILLIGYEGEFSEYSLITKLNSKLPETHIILLADEIQVMRAIEILGDGAYDYIEYPLLDDRVLTQSIDRGIERDFYLYMNEQLKERVSSSSQTKSTPRQMPEESDQGFTPVDLEWAEKLTRLESIDDVAKEYTKVLSESHNDSEVLFLKYMPNHRTLVASASVQKDLKKMGALSVNLVKDESGRSVEELLEHPHKIATLSYFLEEQFHCDDFMVEPLIVEKETLGLFIILAKEVTNSTGVKWLYKKQIMQLRCQAIHLSRRFRRMNTFDEKTSVLNRQSFLMKITEEVSRSRRTHLPLSFILIAIDHFEQLSKKYSETDMELMVKAVAKIISQNSRVNDIVGRVGPGEFGLLLPHTPLTGAEIKGSRLGKVIQSADFSKFIKTPPKMTVCMGVSTYPNLSSDADDLFQTADEVLYQVRKKGSNQIGIASVEEDFEPDFEIE